MSELDDKIFLATQIAEEQRQIELPHLYSFKFYDWAREFYESNNKINLLCAANQISKSSTQIRKCIHWATETSLWPLLWPQAHSRGQKPNQFWYLYPSLPVLEAEFATKWLEFLPRGDMKDDRRYGWREIRKRGELKGIKFLGTGVIVFFKYYSQKAADLQSGSVYAMFADEEMPVELYDELIIRMIATNGYFHMVFTATLGQEFWRKAMEPKETEDEVLPGALKRQVSLYDSMKYEDGSPSQWTEERISQVKNNCKSHAEVLKRVFGKFVLAGGRKYEKFDASRHMKKSHPIPRDWTIYAGADPGSGGQKGHAAALCYVAVRPDFRQGRVIAGWRGDGEVTDSAAVVRKHKEIKLEKNILPMLQFYDWASADFKIVAQGMDETFLPAEKSHEAGESIINTLFGNDMMAIYETPELAKLATELSTLKADENKRRAKDNFADAFRYAVTKIPWDFSQAGLMAPAREVDTSDEKLSPYQQQIKERRAMMEESDGEEKWPTADEEIEEWNEIAGG